MRDRSQIGGVATAEPVQAAFPGLETIEHEFQLPLSYEDPSAGSLTVFAREVAAPDSRGRPYLLFLQGGPGHESPRPFGKGSPEWIYAAVEDFRVILLDQRGTGRSSPIDSHSLPAGPPAEQAELLSNFRADSIVRDAERIREALDIGRWTILGESFGGFCVLNYLSVAADGVEAALISGGLPPLAPSVDEVYVATHQRVREKEDAYFRRYPGDRARAREISDWLGAEDVRLPAGDPLTRQRFSQLGWLLGMTTGFEHLHYLLELPLHARSFLVDVERALPFDRQPLYSVLHEACWVDGGVSGWSAERTLEPDEEASFTGEHIYRWMFDQYEALRPFKEAADLLADREWGRLYDEDQLRRNEVPAAAAIYADDMYCDSRFSLPTAAVINKLKPWLTNEFDHDGLGVDARVFGYLMELARGER